jgi:selenocysteine lyase/cysteine desulfurase
MRKDMQERVWPCVTEGYLACPVTCETFKGRGQQVSPAIAALTDVIDLQNTIGKDTIQQRVLALNKYCKEKIMSEWGAEKLLSPAPDAEELCTGLVAFNPFETPYATQPNKTSAVYRALYEKNIAVRTVGYKEKHADEKSICALRISTHLYNTYEQIDTALEEVKEIIKTLS